MNCLHCQKPIARGKYCSSACKQSAYRQRKKATGRKTISEQVAETVGVSVTTAYRLQLCMAFLGYLEKSADSDTVADYKAEMNKSVQRAYEHARRFLKYASGK